MQEVPLLSTNLIKKLDEEYPLELPDPNDSDKVIWIKVGQRRVINQLISLLKQSEENL